MSDVAAQVISCGEAARAGARNLAAAPDESINVALRGMAALLTKAAATVLAANADDLADGEAAGLGRGLLDRLRLDEARLAEMARQISLLAASPFPPAPPTAGLASARPPRSRRCCSEPSCSPLTSRPR